MPKRIILKDGGLTGGTAPTGYKYLGISGGNLSVQSGATISNAGGGSSPEFTYSIGEYVSAQGGVIFHRFLDGGVQNYLVVDISNVSTGVIWSSESGALIGQSAQSIWNGASNSVAILSQFGANSGAAFNCDNSSSGGKIDWYLPSIDELKLLNINRFNVNKTLSGNSSAGSIGGAVEILYNIHWSSTEQDYYQALYFNFLTGTSYYSPKNNSYYVRAIRKFSI
jgi:hypothetical protein